MSEIAIKRVAVCALLLCATASFHAKADIWSYVDERGVAHFASSQLDPRYEVFFRGSANPEAQTDDGRAAPVILDSTATNKVAAWLESSANFRSVEHLVRGAATNHKVDFSLLKALIATESGFDASAVSPKGAVGLMQVIPDTANRYGLMGNRKVSIQTKLKDPHTNLQTGTRYLRDLLIMFPGQLELALAAYNAGEGAVQRAGNKIPNFPETQNYVKTVMQLYYSLNPMAAPRVVRAPLSGNSASAGNGVVTHISPPASPHIGTTGRGNMVPSVTSIPAAPAPATRAP
ncbi:MAG: lytic transglycosylase domain-containing protein [Rhodoferax sp.]|nr:lytic transglycosylase domain-containing protein [Rhodoferax sp.]